MADLPSAARQTVAASLQRLLLGSILPPPHLDFLVKQRSPFVLPGRNPGLCRLAGQLLCCSPPCCSPTGVLNKDADRGDNPRSAQGVASKLWEIMVMESGWLSRSASVRSGSSCLGGGVRILRRGG